MQKFQFEQIVNTFKTISELHYLPGNYVYDLDDNFNLDGLETFQGIIVNHGRGFDCKAHQDDEDYPARVEQPFGLTKTYKVIAYKLKCRFGEQELSFSQVLTPRVEHFCADFESLFGFGERCGGFRTDKKIVVCSRDRVIQYDDLHKLIETQNVDREMLKFLLWLSIHGGYINKNIGLMQLNKQLSTIIQCEELSHEEIKKFVYLK